MDSAFVIQKVITTEDAPPYRMLLITVSSYINTYYEKTQLTSPKKHVV